MLWRNDLVCCSYSSYAGMDSFKQLYKRISVGVSSKVSNLQLKYNGKIYDAFDSSEKLMDDAGYVRGTRYKFKIDSFWKFRMADDKALIVTGKDGFVQELLVELGVVNYYNWSFP